nr:MaoC family dehydratase [Rhizocola hellebori]
MRVAFDVAAGLPIWRPKSDLPPLSIEITPTFVVSSALATRDFQDVHHDRDLAIAKGSKDIFVNILTTTGLVQRFVTDWKPQARVTSIAIKLGVPCYAYDMLTFSGRVTSPTTIEVVGRNSLGAHVTGSVEVADA